MATKFTKGEEVRVAGVIPSGPVQAFRMDNDGIVYCLISWQDIDGGTQQRWFSEAELVAV
jgi:uncharacterized protein YodC (DUF2158 family)